METFVPPAAGVPTVPPWKTLGTLLCIGHGKARIAADVSAVELRHNPHKANLESNPYAVLALPDGREIVADAAGNDLHVGELNGLREKPTARVRRVDPRTGKILGWKSGFGPISGLAVNGGGDLYISRLMSGVVTKVSNGRRTHVKVPFPAGVSVDPYDGKVYVSAWSVADRDGTVLEGEETPGGQVWKILGF